MGSAPLDNRRPDIDGARTIGQLVADASRDVSTLVRSEIELAKAEVTGGLKVAGKGAGMLGAAGFVALLGLIFLFHTLAYVLDIWLPLSASYAIVTGLLFLVAAILGLLGKKAVSKAKPKPEQAITEAQKTVEAVKSSL
ncbi:MAG: phage holin family protein [Actinobacteria bacterium]|uniref:phage holin family protein n=1 Tax=Nostocoides veronense TaxID=330836 RepID=UPI0031CF5AB8|nr:phage holin family protein [Actinomycetota bacterium]